MAKIGILVLVAFSILLSATTAISATDEQICRAGRARASGKYEKCVQDWLGAFYKTGSADQLKLSKCRLKYALAFMNLQGLSGTTCDAPRWVDNGDGTVTDNLTGLVWEQKSDDGTLHDWDDLTTLTSAADADLTDEDGPAFTTFLASLNSGGGFAGANGWRVPSFAELQTILLPGPYPCIASPCIDDQFGPFTKSGLYASATTSASNPLDALAVNFVDGYAQANGKSLVTHVRAVRGGF